MNKYYVFCLLIVWLSGCGVSTADVKTLCDGREGPVLTLRSDTVHQLPHERGMFVENGVSYVTLDGQCHFWTWGYVPREKSLGSDMRVKVRKGTLNEDQRIELLSLLKWKEWSEIYGTALAARQGGGDTIYTGDSKGAEFSFSIHRVGDHSGLRREIVLGLEDATAFLYAIGEPVEPERVRIFVDEQIEDSWWEGREVPPLFINWPDFGVDVQDLADAQNPYCFGKSLLVEDENAVKIFTKARNDYAAQLSKTFPSLMGVIDKDGGKHRLFVRDVLPFENELGLVEQGSYGAQLCF